MTEDHLIALRDNQRRLETALAELRGRVAHLPNILHLMGFVLAVLTITGLVRVFAP